MNQSTDRIKVVLEVGKVRTFAISPDWPGWCRSARNEEQALQALIDYGSRYAHVLQQTSLACQSPSSVSELHVVERLSGNTTTDFGAPDSILSTDALRIEMEEMQRMQTILEACWTAFNDVRTRAAGKELRTGPRGGGRALQKIIEHVIDVEVVYLAKLGGNINTNSTDDLDQKSASLHQAILTTLESAIHGEIPERGPRGGLR